MATPTIAERLRDVPLRNSKADLGARRNLTPCGAIVDHARKTAGLEVKQMADLMGVSESFLLRGFKDQEHLSYQRLQLVAASCPGFHRAFLIAQAEATDGVDVLVEIRVRREA
jgi:AraC-like DNA-binding protein